MTPEHDHKRVISGRVREDDLTGVLRDTREFEVHRLRFDYILRKADSVREREQ